MCYTTRPHDPMSRSLIINARHRLAWHQRLFSDASTAMAWGGWLWLWSPVLRSSATAAELGARSYPALMKLVGNGSVDDLQRSVLALIGTSGTLLAWSKLPARKAPETKAVSLREHAEQFGLTERELESARHAPVCVVRHDERGRIIGVECREPAGHRQALSA